MDFQYSKTSKQGCFGDNINLDVVSFVERFSEVQSVLKLYRKQLFQTLKVSFVQRYVVLCPYLGGSTIGGFTVIEKRWFGRSYTSCVMCDCSRSVVCALVHCRTVSQATTTAKTKDKVTAHVRHLAVCTWTNLQVMLIFGWCRLS